MFVREAMISAGPECTWEGTRFFFEFRGSRISEGIRLLHPEGRGRGTQLQRPPSDGTSQGEAGAWCGRRVSVGSVPARSVNLGVYR